MARNPLHEVAIVGAYNTPQGKILPDWTEPALLVDAIRGGLANAGLEPKDVDGVNTFFFLSLISLITTVHDRYRPVLATRVMAERREAAERPTA